MTEFAIRTEGLGKQYRVPHTRDRQQGPETAAAALVAGLLRSVTRGGMIHGQDRARSSASSEPTAPARRPS